MSAGVDAPPAAYGDITNPSSWQSFGPSIVDAGARMAYSFWSAAFDGRYVYYAPLDYYGGNYSGLVVRYDTQANFITSTAWSSFDLAALNPGAVGYAGAVFDGRYVYFVPYVTANGSSITVQQPRRALRHADGSFLERHIVRSVRHDGVERERRGVRRGRVRRHARLLRPVLEQRQRRQRTHRRSLRLHIVVSHSDVVGGVRHHDRQRERRRVRGRRVRRPLRLLRAQRLIGKTGVVARYDSQGSFTSAAGWAPST